MTQQIQPNSVTVTAPPVAKKAPFLRDADGNIYLWTQELAERGDLVAAYDPDNPNKFEKDNASIALNRELEMAQERGDREEAARIEAVQAKERAEREAQEAAELQEATARQRDKAEAELQEERERHAKEMAEMQAKLDAMAKQKVAEPEEPAEPAEEKPKKKKAPAKKAKVEEPSVADQIGDDLDDFGN